MRSEVIPIWRWPPGLLVGCQRCGRAIDPRSVGGILHEVMARSVPFRATG